MRRGLVIACATLAAPMATFAAKDATLSLSQQTVYDSNPLRLPTGAESLFGGTSATTLTLTHATPMNAVESTSTVQANYFDDSAYNSIDWFETLRLSRDTARWQAGITGKLAYDTTRTSEITNFAQNVPDVRSRKLALAPEISFKADSRTRLKLMTSATDVSYDNNAFTDYALYTLTPSYEYKLSEQHTAHVDLRAQRYETTEGAALYSDSVGPMVGIRSSFNRSLSGGLAMGAVHVDKHGEGAGSDDRDLWNYVFRGTLRYQEAATVWDASATRAREPFGNGTETLLDTFTLNRSQQINPSLKLDAQGKYQSADYSGSPGVNLDHGLTLGGGLSYRLTEHSDLSGEYRYRDEKLTNVTGNIAQHVVMLTLAHRPEL